MISTKARDDSFVVFDDSLLEVKQATVDGGVGEVLSDGTVLCCLKINHEVWWVEERGCSLDDGQGKTVGLGMFRFK